MAFYEQKNSGASFTRTRFNRSVNMNFPVHFHTSFELLAVEEEGIEVTVDDTLYLPKKGDIILIPPDSAHSYRTREHSVIWLIIFCSDYISEIYEEIKTGVRRDPLIRDGAELYRALRESGDDHCLFRSQLYQIASKYFKNSIISGKTERNRGFIAQFSEYLSAHSHEPLCEKDVARALGYHPRYLSLLVKKNFGVGFRTVLNDYRIRNACEMLRSEKHNITEVYLAAGFESQCAFNRNFKAIMGVTPLKYRQGYRIGGSGHPSTHQSPKEAK